MTPTARARATSIVAAALVGYLVLLGGTTWGEIHLVPRIINALIGGTLLVIYVVRIPEADRVDGLVLLAVGAFFAATAMSEYPRQSLDAAIAAITYAAGLFVARRLLADATVRVAVLRTLMGLSLGLVLLTASRWLIVAEWWALTGWSVTPPLNMELDATPWGHRHDLALLVAMLYPAWWVGPRSRLRTALALVVGALTALIVVVDGSRALWVALVVASAILVAPRIITIIRRHPVPALAAAGAVAVALIALILVGGPARAFLERTLTIDTLIARIEMWRPLLADWSTDPIAGHGPASFPFALQHTPYFTAHAWAPRHPDNILIQAVVEAGVLGLMAIALVVAAVAPALVRSSSTAALWALVVFAVASIGSNPTDFAFLVVPAIVWTAYAIPRPAGAVRTTWVTYTTLATLALIFVASASSIIGAAFYESARIATARGDLEAAGTHLSTARGFDPSLALYSRALGVVQLASGDPQRAVSSLERATQLAPTDDLAWRALAIAHHELGETAAGVAAIQWALDAQRSEPANLMVLATLFETDSREAAIAEIVQAWPFVVMAPGWDAFSDIPQDEAIAAAIERWMTHPESPEREVEQPLVLVTWAGMDDLTDEAIAAGSLSEDVAGAYQAVIACDPDAARDLDALPDASRRTPVYWMLRIRDAADGTDEGARYQKIHALMTGRTLAEPVEGAGLSPFDGHDLAGFSLDEWGYRRPPFPTVAWEFTLPSPSDGEARWVLGDADADDPAAACSP